MYVCERGEEEVRVKRKSAVKGAQNVHIMAQALRALDNCVELNDTTGAFLHLKSSDNLSCTGSEASLQEDGPCT